MLSYFPSSTMISEALGLDLANEKGPVQVSVPLTVLKLFIRSALAGAPFDEEFYLRRNPDIEIAWKAGQIADLRQHFIENGYFEGRKAWPIEVDEKWYVGRYKDVALALKDGQVDSAQRHYENAGESEWRAPTEAAGANMQEWRSALMALGRGRSALRDSTQ